MKKYKKKVMIGLHIPLILCILSLFGICNVGIECRAQEYDVDAEIRTDVDGVVEDFYEILPDGVEIGTIDEASEYVGIKSLMKGVIGTALGQKGAALSFLMTLIGVGMISAVASLGNKEMCTVSSRAVGTVSSALLFERLISLVVGARSSLAEIGEFFGALIPIGLTVNSIGASPSTASTQAIGMGLTLGAYTFISQKLLAPLVTAVFVASAVSGIDPLFGKISKGIKGVFLWTVGIFTALVSATFSLQSAISSSADSAVIRGARYAISGSIPIVGNAVSGALGLVAGGASYARGLIGGGSIAVVFALALSPLITLLIYRLCLRLGIFFSTVCSLDTAQSVLTSFLGAFDALIATYALTCTVYTVELVAFLKGGAGFA